MASLVKYGSTPSNSVYQRVAAGRSTAQKFMVLIPRSMVTSLPCPRSGSPKIAATSDKIGAPDLSGEPGLYDIDENPEDEDDPEPFEPRDVKTRRRRPNVLAPAG